MFAFATALVGAPVQHSISSTSSGDDSWYLCWIDARLLNLEVRMELSGTICGESTGACRSVATQFTVEGETG